MTTSINQWLAGTSGGEVATSPDGATWTIQSSFAAAFGAHQVNYAVHTRPPDADLWIVVGAAGHLATSADGITWTSRTSGFGTSDINAVAYNLDSLFVAVGAAKKAFYSADGVTWAACALPGGWSGSTVLTGVAHDFIGHWLLTGHDGGTPVAAQSSDGHTFTSVTLPSLTGTPLCLIHDHVGLFVIATTASEIISSPNRTTWTTQTPTSNPPHSFSSLASDEKVGTTSYFVGSSGQHVYYTTDFASYLDEEASPGSGPSSGLCVACDGISQYAVGGVPIGTAELEYNTVGSSLGTAVVIGFSTGITALAHSNPGTTIAIFESMLGAPDFVSTGTLSNVLAESADASVASDYIFRVLKAITESAECDDSVLWKQVANLFERAGVKSAATSVAGFTTAVVETGLAHNIVSVCFFVGVNEGANATDAVAKIYTIAEAIVEAAAIKSGAGSLARFINAVVIAGNMKDGAVFGWYEQVAESAGIGVTQVNSFDALGKITESAALAVILAQHVSIPILIAEAIAADEEWTVKADLINFIEEGGCVAIQISLGDSDYTAWVLNTKTLGATQYTNFAFNSFAEIARGVWIGCKRDGLFELTGDDDSGTPIDLEIRTGLMMMAAGREARVPYAYIAARTDGSLVMKVVKGEEPDGELHEFWYEVEVRAMSSTRTTRSKLGKGTKAVWWQFALSNVRGSTLELAQLKLYPVILDRRIS